MVTEVELTCNQVGRWLMITIELNVMPILARTWQRRLMQLSYILFFSVIEWLMYYLIQVPPILICHLPLILRCYWILLMTLYMCLPRLASQS